MAPYLVRLEPDAPFTDWVLARGWGHHWGIFVHARVGLKTLRSHLRRFLKVKDADGKQLIFRYYDPRVLRVYLPTCNADELEVLFGPVHRYHVEVEDAQALLEYGRANGKLTQRSIALKAPAGASG